MNNAETLIQKKVLEYFKNLELAGHPILFERRQASGLAYKEGKPDLFCVYNGVHIEIEMKVPDGTVRTMQEKYEIKCKKRGIIYMRPNSFEEVKKYFEEVIIPNLRK